MHVFASSHTHTDRLWNARIEEKEKNYLEKKVHLITTKWKAYKNNTRTALALTHDTGEKTNSNVSNSIDRNLIALAFLLSCCCQLSLKSQFFFPFFVWTIISVNFFSSSSFFWNDFLNDNLHWHKTFTTINYWVRPNECVRASGRLPFELTMRQRLAAPISWRVFQ